MENKTSTDLSAIGNTRQAQHLAYDWLLLKEWLTTFPLIMATFVIQKTSHASDATTPLVLLGMMSLFGEILGHQMIISPWCFGTWTQTAFPGMPPLCALIMKTRPKVPYRIGMEWTKSWARNCWTLWKWWVKTISSKPRAWNTPGLNYFEYTNGPLYPYCDHNVSLP